MRETCTSRNIRMRIDVKQEKKKYNFYFFGETFKIVAMLKHTQHSHTTAKST